MINAKKSHTKPQYLFVLGCEDDLSAWARQRCCPLTQSWKSDKMKTTSPHETGRDAALSRNPERRYKMKTTSPSQQIPSSLTELSLVDQIHTHFWTLHQTKLCNCDIPLAQGKNMVSRAMTLQDEPDRGDVRILFYRHSLLQQLDVHIATLSKNINSQLSCTPGFWRLSIYLAQCVLFIATKGAPDPCWGVHRQTQHFGSFDKHY